MIVEEDKQGKLTTKLVDKPPCEFKCFGFFYPLCHITEVSLLSQNSHHAYCHTSISLEPCLPAVFSISVCRVKTS